MRPANVAVPVFDSWTYLILRPAEDNGPGLPDGEAQKASQNNRQNCTWKYLGKVCGGVCMSHLCLLYQLLWSVDGLGRNISETNVCCGKYHNF